MNLEISRRRMATKERKEHKGEGSTANEREWTRKFSRQEAKAFAIFDF
jgi:hypothetical protein